MVRVVVFELLGRTVLELHRETVGPDKSTGSIKRYFLDRRIDLEDEDGVVLLEVSYALEEWAETDEESPF